MVTHGKAFSQALIRAVPKPYLDEAPSENQCFADSSECCIERQSLLHLRKGEKENSAALLVNPC